MNDLPEDRRDRFCTELEDVEFRPMTLEELERLDREAQEMAKTLATTPKNPDKQ